ncbi:hypothetical protein HK105_203826 [Polyrhizophydium stewartii]|uniref:F-box domain-containing protein n=1 Tax=Polyrhizophydium stewartii TaxID=2732419 RepID=A0ABR4NB19_9FUNG|nr:hypothetical protein HK105_004257 [Polyrhizophydium stewartii]
MLQNTLCQSPALSEEHPETPAAMTASMGSLPPELLAHILGFLDFEELLPRLPLTLKVKATQTTKRIGLDAIVARFPLLRELVLESSSSTSGSGGSGSSTMLVHEVAHQFRGHPTLQRITSASDVVMRGVMSGCPSIEELRLPSDAVVRDDGDDDMVQELRAEQALGRSESAGASRPFDPDTLGPRGRRNVGLILRALPALKHLEIDGPSFWRRQVAMQPDGSAALVSSLGGSHALAVAPTPAAAVSQLETLKMTSINSWSLTNFLAWLASPGEPKLPHLRSLYLDIDYLHFPPSGIRAIAHGCPNLRALKLKFGILARETLFDIATHLHGLERLSLSKCDLWFVSANWAHVCVFLASHLGATLRTISMSMCTIQVLEDAHWHARFESLATRPIEPAAALRSLKLLDTGDARPDAAVLHALLTAFPALEVLRMDVTGDCLPAWDPVFADVLRRGMRGLRVLELRSGKPSMHSDPVKRAATLGMDDGTSSPRVADIAMPHLRDLSLWCFATIPHYLIRPNTATIERLSISYPVVVSHADDDGDDAAALLVSGGASRAQTGLARTEYAFPRLAHLEVRGLSNAAHGICLAALDMATHAAPRLASLTIEAFSRVTAPFPMRTLQRLAHASPDLRALRISSFVMPDDALARVAAAWPLLETLELTGTHCIGAIDGSWHARALAPFMASHRRLSRLALGVSRIAVPGFELLSSDAIMAKLSARGNLLPQDFDGEFVHIVQSANAAAFRRYAAVIRSMYPALRECVLRGPFEVKG